MRIVHIELLAIGLVGVACRPVAGSGGDPNTPAPVDEAPSRKPGAVLEAVIPLYAGGAVELQSFRGKAVVLELSATYADGWEPAHEHYRALLDAHGETALSVIVVSMDMEAGRIQRHWDRDPPPFVLGWDPQGALAVRLGVQQLPTVFVLDPQGRVLLERGGWSEGVAAEVGDVVRDVVREAAGTG